MEDSKPKNRLSIIAVIIIFILLYLGELGIGAGVFFYIVLPKIKDFQQQEITQELETDQKLHPEKAEFYKLYQQLSPEVSKDLPNITKLLNDKKYEETITAINNLQPKIKNDADRVFANYILVQVYTGQKDQDKIKKVAQDLIKYGPNFSFGYSFLAEANLNDKNTKGALDNAKKAVELNPSQAYYHYLLGIALYWNYQDGESLVEVKKAIQLDPQNQEYKKQLDYQQKKTTTQTNPASQTSGPGYTQADIKSWQDEISYINQDLANIPHFLGNSSYDQSKLNQMSALLDQRKTIANQIYTKMVNNQTLTTQDQQSINTYDQLTSQYASISKQVFPHQ